MKILHITPHLGGGMGKFLSGIIKQAKICDISDISDNEHIIVCLDKPEKMQHINKIRQYDGKVIECPTKNELEDLMKKSDIVQLEYINNPIIFKYLCMMDIPPIRIVVLSHNNGIFNPIIPKEFIENSHKFIITSPCSWETLSNTYNHNEDIGCIYSSGGFEEFPFPVIYRKIDEKMSVGYFGSTIFSKMHPYYADYINEIDIPNFKVKIIGDLHNKEILEKQSYRFEFKGFVPDIYSELKSINVLAYILNPEHYGTTENALIESMSIGIVPIVLSNLPEMSIVENNVTGFIVNSSIEFAEIIEYLNNNSDEIIRLGLNAMKSTREKFSIEKTESNLNNYYIKALLMEKRKIDFKQIFGYTPDQWFLSCQGNKKVFKKDGSIDLTTVNEYAKYMLFEETKGSVFHFSKYFPENKKLNQWAENLLKCHL
jgi:glycosyltransferase involved in cell wall biosynthesis